MKTAKKIEKTRVIRLTIAQVNKLREIGNGNVRHGIQELFGMFDILNRDPSLLLNKKLEEYADCVKIFASDNHYNHFIESGLPAMLFRFNKTGSVDKSLLFGQRPEKTIEEFKEKKK